MRSRYYQIGARIMGAFYILAGLNHFLAPDPYIGIMPDWLPWHAAMVALSGVAEIVCGILVLIPRTRPLGAWLTILLLIAIFPANIQMAVDYYREGNPYLWVAVLRLLLQLVLIWWAWLYTRRPTPKERWRRDHAATILP